MKPYLLTTDDFHSPEEKGPGLGKPIRPDPFNAKQPALIPIDKKKGIYQDETGKLQTLIPENEKARFPVNQDCALGEKPASENSPIPASNGWHQCEGKCPEKLIGLSKGRFEMMYDDGYVSQYSVQNAPGFRWVYTIAWRFV